jgi:hypothetical protein
MSDIVAPTRCPRAKKPISEIRAGARDRKARQRVRDAEAGRPELGALDRALGDALRTILGASKESLLTPITPAQLLKETRQQLLSRQRRRVQAGKVGVIYDGAKVSEALRTRLRIPTIA